MRVIPQGAEMRIALTKPEQKSLASAAAILTALSHFDLSLKVAAGDATAAVGRIGADGMYTSNPEKKETDSAADTVVT